MQKLNRLISVILILSMLLSSFPMAAIAQDVSEEPAAEVIEAPAPAEEIQAEPEPVYEEPAYEEPVYEESVYEEPVYEEPAYEAPAEEVTVSEEPPAGEAMPESPAEPEAPAEVTPETASTEPAAETAEAQPEVPAEPEPAPIETEAAPAEKQINEIYSEVYVKAERLGSCLKLENVYAGYGKEKNTLTFHLTGDTGKVTFYVPVMFDEEEKAVPWTVTGEDLRKLPEQRIILIQGDAEGSLKGAKNLTPEWVGDIPAILVDLAGHGGDRELRELAVTECMLPQPAEEPAPAAGQPAAEAPEEEPASETGPEETPAEEEIPAGNEEPVTAEEPAAEAPAAEQPAEEPPVQSEAEVPAETPAETVPEVPAEKPLRFASEEILLHVGDTLTPEIVNTEGKATLMGLSSETEAVRLEGDTLTALAEGETTMFLASADPLEITDMIPVRVVADEIEIPAAETVDETDDGYPRFSVTEAELPVGETLTLEVLNPEEKEILVGLSGDTEAVLWDESTLTMTGLSAGKVTAFLSTLDPLEVKSLCAVQVVITEDTASEAAADAQLLSEPDPQHDESVGITKEQMEALRLDRSYLVLAEDDEPIQLNVTGIPENAIAFRSWIVEDSDGETDQDGAVTVDINGVVTPIHTGTSFVSVVVDNLETEVKLRCRVDVVSRVASTITNVSLTTNKAAIELYQTNYTKLTIFLDFPQNLNGTMSVSSVNPLQNGSAIETARFENADAAKYFDLRVADDRTLEIIPTDIALVFPGRVGNSYKSAIIITGKQWQAKTDPLTLTVKKTLPKITAKAIKFNSFIDLEAMPLVFSGGTVLTAEADPAKTNPDWLELDGMSLRLTETAKNQKISGKYSLKVTAEGYTDLMPIPVTVSVSAAVTAPKLTFKPASLTLNPAAGDEAGTTASVNLAQYADADIEVISVKEGKTEYAPVAAPISCAAAGLTLTCSARDEINSSAAHTFTVTLGIGGNAKAGTVTVKTLKNTVVPSMTVKAAGTINTEVPGSPVTLTVTAKNFVPAGEYRVSFTRLNGKTEEPAEEGIFITAQDGNIITVTEGEGLTAGTYYAYVSLNVNGKDVTAPKAKVTVKNDPKAVKSAALKLKGNLDPIRPSVSVTVTATLKNWYGHEASPADLVFYRGTGKTAALIGNPDEIPFDVVTDGNVYQVFLKDGAQIDPKTQKFSVGMKDEDGIVRTASPVALTVKMGTVKITQNTKTVELMRNDRFDSAEIRFGTTDPTLGGIDHVVLVQSKNTKPFEVVDLGNGIIAVKYAGDRVTVADKTKSVKLSFQIFLAGNVSGKANGTASVTVNLVNSKKEGVLRPMNLLTANVEPAGAGTVRFLNGDNLSVSSAATGESVILDIVPNEGYEFVSVRYREADESQYTILTDPYELVVNGRDLEFMVEFMPEESVVWPEYIWLNTTRQYIHQSASLQLSAFIEPENASPNDVTWESGNTDLAIVDDKGYVIPRQAGTVTVTARTANDLTAECEIHIVGNDDEIETPIIKSIRETGSGVITISWNDLGPGYEYKIEKIGGSIIPAPTEIGRTTLSSFVYNASKIGLMTFRVYAGLKVNRQNDATLFGNYAERSIFIHGPWQNNSPVKIKDLTQVGENRIRASWYEVSPADYYEIGVWNKLTQLPNNVKAIEVVESNLTSGSAEFDFTNGNGLDSTGASYAVRAVYTDGNGSTWYSDWSETVGISMQPAPISVSIQPSFVSMAIGETSVLSSLTEPKNNNGIPVAYDTSVTWSTNDPSVAVVDENGIVTAMGEGSAIITAATVNGQTDTCEVEVVHAAVRPESIAITPEDLTLMTGDDYLLTADVLPDEAENKTITWSSNNMSVATVDDAGGVTAVAEGTAVITAKTSNGLADICVVTVTRKTGTPVITGISQNGYGRVTLQWNSLGEGYLYRVYEKMSAGNRLVGSTSSNSMEFVVTEEGEHAFFIQAGLSDQFGIVHYGDSSEEVSADIQMIWSFNAEITDIVQIGDGSARITWYETTPADAYEIGEFVIDDYQVIASSLPADHFDLSGLSEGTHQFAVRAKYTDQQNIVWASDWSSLKSVVIIPADQLVRPDAVLIDGLSKRNWNLEMISADSRDFTITSSGEWTASADASWITLGSVTGSNNDVLTLNVTANDNRKRDGRVLLQCGEATAVIWVHQIGKFPSLIEPELNDGSSIDNTILPKTDSLTVRWSKEYGASSYQVTLREEGSTTAIQQSPKISNTDTYTFETGELAEGRGYEIYLRRYGYSGGATYYFTFAPDNAWLKLDNQDAASLSESYRTFNADGPDEFNVWDVSASGTWYASVSDPEWMLVDTAPLSDRKFAEKHADSDLYTYVVADGNKSLRIGVMENMTGATRTGSVRISTAGAETTISVIQKQVGSIPAVISPSLAERIYNSVEISINDIDLQWTAGEGSTGIYSLVMEERDSNGYSYSRAYYKDNISQTNAVIPGTKLKENKQYRLYLETEDEETMAAIRTPYYYFHTVSVNELTLTVNVDWSEVNVGGPVSIHASAAGGAGGYQFAYQLLLDGEIEQQTPWDGSIKYYQFRPQTDGSYQVKVFVKDSENVQKTVISDSFNVEHSISAAEISISRTSASMYEGDSLELTASVTPANAINNEIRWVSSDESVASVDQNGKVTAIKTGTVVISAAVADSPEIKAQCEVTVSITVVPIRNIEVNNSAMDLIIGDVGILSASVLPQNAADPGVFWWSSNTSVASVDQDGVITALAEGTAVITVQASNGLTDTCIITVTKKAQKPLITGISQDGNGKITLSWNDPGDGYLYRVYEKMENTNRMIGMTYSNSIEFSTATAGFHTFFVQAGLRNPGGVWNYGDESDEVSVDVQFIWGFNAKITEIEQTGVGSIRITWQKTVPADVYEIAEFVNDQYQITASGLTSGNTEIAGLSEGSHRFAVRTVFTDDQGVIWTSDWSLLKSIMILPENQLAQTDYIYIDGEDELIWYVDDYLAASRNFTVTSFGEWTASVDASWIKLSQASGQNGSVLTLNVQKNTQAARNGSVIIQCGDSAAVIHIEQWGKYPLLIEPDLQASGTEDGISSTHIDNELPKTDSLTVQWNKEHGDTYYQVRLYGALKYGRSIDSPKIYDSDHYTFDTSDLEQGKSYCLRFYRNDTKNYVYYYFFFTPEPENQWLKLDNKNIADLSETDRTINIDGEDTQVMDYVVTANTKWYASVSDPDWMLIDNRRITDRELAEKRSDRSLFTHAEGYRSSYSNATPNLRIRTLENTTGETRTGTVTVRAGNIETNIIIVQDRSGLIPFVVSPVLETVKSRSVELPIGDIDLRWSAGVGNTGIYSLRVEEQNNIDNRYSTAYHREVISGTSAVIPGTKLKEGRQYRLYLETQDEATTKTIRTPYYYFNTVDSNELTLNANVDWSRVNNGGPVMITASAAGGVGDYWYAYQLLHDGEVEQSSMEGMKNQTNYQFNPHGNGNYSVKVFVKDAAGTQKTWESGSFVNEDVSTFSVMKENHYTISLDPDAHTLDYTVLAGISWRVTSVPDWVTSSSLNYTNINHEKSLRLIVARNDGPQRVGKVEIVSDMGITSDLTITQEDSRSIELALNEGVYTGEDQTISIGLVSDERWTATSNAAWAEVNTNSGNPGDGSVMVHLNENTGDMERSAVITITSANDRVQFVITQLWKETVQTAQPLLSLSENEWIAYADGGSKLLTINTSTGWFVKEKPEWVVLYVKEAAAQGTGNSPLNTISSEWTKLEVQDTAVNQLKNEPNTNTPVYSPEQELLISLGQNTTGELLDGNVVISNGESDAAFSITQESDEQSSGKLNLTEFVTQSPYSVNETIGIHVNASAFQEGVIVVSSDVLPEPGVTYFYDADYNFSYLAQRAGEYKVYVGVSTDPGGVQYDVYGLNMCNDVQELTFTVLNDSYNFGGMKPSSGLIDFLISYDTFHATHYTDSNGKPTIGYGHNYSDVSEFDEPISEELAWQLLWGDVASKAKIVNDQMRSYGITLTQQQFDAFVSMAYNGASGIIYHGDYRLWNYRDQYGSFSAIPDEKVMESFVTWHKAPLNSIFGLYRRRCDEAQIFIYGEYQKDSPAQPDWMAGKEPVYRGDGLYSYPVPDGWVSPLISNADYVRLDSESVDLAKVGITDQVLKISSGKAWSAEVSDESWIMVNNKSGAINESLTYSVQENTDPAPRQGTITVRSGNASRTFTISQHGTQTDPISLSLEYAETYYAGETVSVGASVSGGTGNYHYSYTVYSNTGTSWALTRYDARVVGPGENDMLEVKKLDPGSYKMVVHVTDFEGSAAEANAFFTVKMNRIDMEQPKTSGSIFPSNGSYKLDWTAVEKADEYVLRIRDLTTGQMLIGNESGDGMHTIADYSEFGYVSSLKQHVLRIWVGAYSNQVLIGQTQTVATIGPIKQITFTNPEENGYVESGSFTISWDPVSDSQNPVAFLRISVKDKTAEKLIVNNEILNASAVSYPLTGEKSIQNGHEYRVWVGAYTEDGGIVAQNEREFHSIRESETVSGVDPTLVIQQCDPKYKTIKYGNSSSYVEGETIGWSGCGLVAVVNAFMYASGDTSVAESLVNTLASACIEEKTYTYDVLSTAINTVFTKYLNISYKKVTNVSEVEKHVRNGDVAIINCDKTSLYQNSSSGPHFVAIVSYRKNGNGPYEYLLLDSAMINFNGSYRTPKYTNLDGWGWISFTQLKAIMRDALLVTFSDYSINQYLENPLIKSVKLDGKKYTKTKNSGTGITVLAGSDQALWPEVSFSSGLSRLDIGLFDNAEHEIPIISYGKDCIKDIGETGNKCNFVVEGNVDEVMNPYAPGFYIPKDTETGEYWLTVTADKGEIHQEVQIQVNIINFNTLTVLPSSELQERFDTLSVFLPNEKYWNHHVDQSTGLLESNTFTVEITGINGEKMETWYSTKACVGDHHSWEHWEPYYYTEEHFRISTCNAFLDPARPKAQGEAQCIGFANTIGWAIGGESPVLSDWKKYDVKELERIEPGDIVWVKSSSEWGHKFVVLKIENGKVYYVDNNGDGHCKISWVRERSLSDIRKNFWGIKHYSDYAKSIYYEKPIRN